MSIYCVYFTTYSGQLMPPFYIGSTTVVNITENNYHGSSKSKKWVEIWRDELRNHPELFHTEIVSLHETRKEAYDAEEIYQREESVVPNPLYINQCYANSDCRKGRKGTMIVKDVITNIIIGSVKLDHPKVLSGEWISMNRGRKRRDIFTGNGLTGLPGNARKSVLCVELNKIFSSCVEAAKFAKLKSSSCIHGCVYGYQKTAGGYHWKLVEK